MLKSSCYCSEISAFKIIITSVSYMLILIFLYELWYQKNFPINLLKKFTLLFKAEIVKILMSKLMQKNLLSVILIYICLSEFS